MTITHTKSNLLLTASSKLGKGVLSFGVVAAFLMLLSSVALAQQFTNVSTSAGIISLASRSWGNPVWGDLNNDGLLDLIVPKHELTLHGARGDGPPPFVYLNKGDGTFTDFRTASGLRRQNPDTGAWLGFALGDYDGDGNLDLLVAEPPYQSGPGQHQPTRDVLFKGQGNGSFVYVSNTVGLELARNQGESSFWVDYDNDGELDLFVKNIPDFFLGGVNVLYHNNGDGTLTQVPNAGGLADAEHGVTEGTVCSFVDYDNDGFMDATFAGNGVSEALYHNNGDGTFTDVTDSSGLAPHPNATAIAWGDYNNDGLLDLYISRGEPRGKGYLRDTLYRNNGDGTFTDVTDSAGLVQDTNTWAAVWGDYDNDGLLDLFVTRPGTTVLGVGNANLLYHNNGDGTFTDVAAAQGVAMQDNQATSAHKLAAWGDYDNDGFLDLAVKDGIGPTSVTGDAAKGFHFLFHNNGNANHFIKIKLRGVQSNRDGIGARVTAEWPGGSAFRENNGGGGGEYASQGSTPIHFGIKDAAAARITIKWPSGVVDVVRSVAAGSSTIFVEGSSRTTGR